MRGVRLFRPYPILPTGLARGFRFRPPVAGGRNTPPAPLTSAPSSLRATLPKGWKQDHFANRRPVRQQHHQAVYADADAAGGRHAVLERPDVVLIIRLRLLVPGVSVPTLLLEAGPLVVGIVELREGVGDLHPARIGLKPLGQPLDLAVALGERRQL